MSKRVFHLSNRVEIPEPGKATAGGLDEAIALAPEGYEVVRFGWSGDFVSHPEDVEKSVKVTKRENVTYITIDLCTDQFNGFYNNMANGFLWPLFHYRTDIAIPGFDRSSIKDYFDVNKQFADIAARYIQPEDSVIVHDYHLLPCGKCLQENKVENPLSFFLHIPAPSANLLEELNQNQQDLIYRLMESLYHYDFVGLQSQNDFLNLKTILHDQQDPSAPANFETSTWRKNVVPGRTTHFGPFPVAGNTMSYVPQAEEWADRPETKAFLKKHAPNGQADTLSIDRLDYSKGLVAKAYGVGRWLRDFAEKDETLNFMQIAPFGRSDVLAYQREQAAVEAAFGMLHSSFNDSSVLYQDKVARPLWLGMSRLAKIGLVTPIRDGFNLVACEMLASWDKKDPGALVLSKYVGAAGLLREASIQVDPMRAADIARGIQQARQMTLMQRQDLHGRGMEILEGHTNEKWQNGLIEAARISAAPRLT